MEYTHYFHRAQLSESTPEQELILPPLKLRPPLKHGPNRTEEVARWQQNQPNRLNAGRPNCAKRQARAQLTEKVSWNQWASSRRRAGLRLFSQGLRQHMLVEGEIGHQPFESDVLLFQLPKSTEFTHAEVGILLFPCVEGLLGDAELPTDIPNRGATLGLPNGIHDLLFGEFRPLHRSTPFVEDRRSRHLTLLLKCRRFPGRRQAKPLSNIARVIEHALPEEYK